MGDFRTRIKSSRSWNGHALSQGKISKSSWVRPTISVISFPTSPKSRPPSSACSRRTPRFAGPTSANRHSSQSRREWYPPRYYSMRNRINLSGLKRMLLISPWVAFSCRRIKMTSSYLVPSILGRHSS